MLDRQALIALRVPRRGDVRPLPTISGGEIDALIERGIEKRGDDLDDDLEALTQADRQVFERALEPGAVRDTDAAVRGAVLRTVTGMYESDAAPKFVAHWIAELGVEQALASLLAATIPGSHPTRRGQWKSWPHSDGWFALRAALAVVDDAKRRACTELAARHRAAADGNLRCILAFTFPEQAAWANEEARSVLESEQHAWSAYPLLSSIDDRELVPPLLAYDLPIAHHRVGPHAADALLLAGESVVETLLTILAHADNPTQRRDAQRSLRPLVAALACVDRADVAGTLQRWR